MNNNNNNFYVLGGRRGGGGGAGTNRSSALAAAAAAPPLPPPPPPVQDNKKKKYVWGSATWYMLHTCIHKMIDEKFDTAKLLEFREILSMVCHNLPCPECSGHSSTYLANVRFDKLLPTKEELRRLFFEFHNNVNARKGYAPFPAEDLFSKYDCAVTDKIFTYFFYAFEEKGGFIPKLIADAMHRKFAVGIVKKWFAKNRDCFSD